MDAMLGRLGAAEREIRAAQATGQLPPDVERAVRFYAAALAAAKPLGGSIELFNRDSGGLRACIAIPMSASEASA